MLLHRPKMSWMICENPHSLSSSFAERMITLKDSLDRVKLPESAAREFF